MAAAQTLTPLGSDATETNAASPERIAQLTGQLVGKMQDASKSIVRLNNQTRILTFNAQVEAARTGGPAGAADQLISRCRRFTAYFACEQTVNGAPASLIVYTAGDQPGRLNTRTITPNGLAGGRGDLTLLGSRWTYIDRPPASLKGDWSRTENIVTDRDHIRFEEYTSSDEGKSWRLTNAGEEVRRSNPGRL